MIINHFSNIDFYSGIIPHFEKVAEILRSDWSRYVAGKNEIDGDNVFVIKVEDEQNKETSGLLEVHRRYWDIHLTLEGTDVIFFKSLQRCVLVNKAYDLKDDYALYEDVREGNVTVPEQYFCVIDPSMAHMALEGKGKIAKLIIKVKCN